MELVFKISSCVECQYLFLFSGVNSSLKQPSDDLIDLCLFASNDATTTVSVDGASPMNGDRLSIASASTSRTSQLHITLYQIFHILIYYVIKLNIGSFPYKLDSFL